MREVPSRLMYVPSHLRITPAYAGSTLFFGCYLVVTGDHPRVCGKYAIPLFFENVFLGSPPRMREVPVRFRPRNQQPRITPAYAGSTMCLNQVHVWYGDHPRVCGKYSTIKKLYQTKVGSPPRMREVQETKRDIAENARITPAYAGST